MTQGGARGGAVTVLSQVGKYSIQVVCLVVLSRLLEPADFGLVAMLTVFVALGDTLRDFGLPTAALQARTLSTQQSSNLFWANTLLGGALWVLLAASTPLIVGFYGEVKLAAITPVLASILFLNGIQVQFQVQLARSMRFTAIAVTEVGAQMAGAGVAIIAAWIGWAYWSLVAQLIAVAIVLLLTRWLALRWVPSLPRRGAGTMAILRSGGHFGLAHLLGFTANNVDTLAIGNRWGPTDLGFYNRAFQLLTAPISGLLGPLTQVVVPTINRALQAGATVGDRLLKVQSVLGIVIVGTLTVAAAVADPLIVLALGDKWIPSVTIFQILAIGGCVQTFSFVSYWAFILEQKSNELLRYNLVTKSMAIVLVVAASFNGVQAVAWAYSAGLVLSWPINLVWLRVVASYNSWKFFLQALGILVPAATAFGVTAAVLEFIDLRNNWVELLLGGMTASTVFVGAIAILPSGQAQLSQLTGAIKSVFG